MLVKGVTGGLEVSFVNDDSVDLGIELLEGLVGTVKVGLTSEGTAGFVTLTPIDFLAAAAAAATLFCSNRSLCF